MQSNLHGSMPIRGADHAAAKTRTLFPINTSPIGPETRRRLLRTAFIYGAVYLIALMSLFGLFGTSGDVFAAGLVFPGGGFLAMGQADAIWLAAGTGLLFVFAIGLWFATGNVLLAPLVWLGTASMAAMMYAHTPADPATLKALFAFGPALLLAGLSGLSIQSALGQKRRKRLNASLASLPVTSFRKPHTERPHKDELSLKDLQALRLLLDRALQPVDKFEGFEWLDQFQTAAIRYQINFISYALSLTQSLYLPACQAQFSDAQHRLQAKLEDHRVWGYWALENLWGNLRMSSDPVARDNIMYSGFVAAQMAYAANAGHSALQPLQCRKAGETKHEYTLGDMVSTLAAQYQTARYGLLPCEPNWIYPLCNAITASGMRAFDARNGTAHWQAVSARFRHYLETEFISAGGKFVPFRSSYTGLAAPQIGGAVMQAFPCFFLNATLPDLAERQWSALREDMAQKDWTSALWPVDVGNYRFSRASSFGATALAARELGDHDTANLLLERFDAACPRRHHAGVAHHKNASLWAHTNVYMARIGKADMLRNLVTGPAHQPERRPHISEAAYPDVLIAKAVETNGALELVLYPGRAKRSYALVLGGLVSGGRYHVCGQDERTCQADRFGRLSLDLPLSGRTALNIYRKE